MTLQSASFAHDSAGLVTTGVTLFTLTAGQLIFDIFIVPTETFEQTGGEIDVQIGVQADTASGDTLATYLADSLAAVPSDTLLPPQWDGAAEQFFRRSRLARATSNDRWIGVVHMGGAGSGPGGAPDAGEADVYLVILEPPA